MFWSTPPKGCNIEYTPKCPICSGTPVKSMLLSPGSDFWHCRECDIDVERYRKEMAEGTARPVEKNNRKSGLKDDAFIYIGDD